MSGCRHPLDFPLQVKSPGGHLVGSHTVSNPDLESNPTDTDSTSNDLSPYEILGHRHDCYLAGKSCKWDKECKRSSSLHPETLNTYNVQGWG